MKKILTAMTMLFVACVFANAQGAPAFDEENAEFAIIIDVKANKGAKDKVVLVNLAANEAAKFIVYTSKKDKGWVRAGSGMLKSLYDRTSIEPDDGLKKINYVAVVPADSKKYDFKINVASSDLYVYLLPQPEESAEILKNATELDVEDIQGKIKDNIRFISIGKDISDAGFFVFASNGGEFELIGAAYLNRVGDTCFARRCDVKVPLGSYSKFAVATTGENSFTYDIEAQSNDLYIYVR